VSHKIDVVKNLSRYDWTLAAYFGLAAIGAAMTYLFRYHILEDESGYLYWRSLTATSLIVVLIVLKLIFGAKE
jgi:hypothetical protein